MPSWKQRTLIRDAEFTRSTVRERARQSCRNDARPFARSPARPQTRSLRYRFLYHDVASFDTLGLAICLFSLFRPPTGRRLPRRTQTSPKSEYPNDYSRKALGARRLGTTFCSPFRNPVTCEEHRIGSVKVERRKKNTKLELNQAQQHAESYDLATKIQIGL